MANVQRVPPDLGVDDVVLLVPEEETAPEHDLHRLLVDQLLAGVRAWFAGHDDVAVHSRLAWFPDRSDTRVRLDPDVMVVHGRPQGERKSFKSWVEGGAVPQVIVEVWSEDDTDSDYQQRLQRARAYGVGQVVMVDPFEVGGTMVRDLVIDPDDATRYVAAATSTTAEDPIEVPLLGARLAGGRDLVVTDLDGGPPWPLTHDALRLLADARRRLAAASARADREGARVEELRARLREAGLDDEVS
ncbi:hypothetical protein BH23ACT8_BH23ACT8_08500 [soil metagenome]